MEMVYLFNLEFIGANMSEETEHNHSHGFSKAKEKPLIIALLLTGTFFFVELFTGIFSGSLALISDATHMLTDVIGIAIALVAIKIAKRPADLKRTYGYYRFEILAPSFNAFLLFFVGIYIIYESYERFMNKDTVDLKIGPMFFVAIAGLIINLISMKILSSGKDGNLNLKGAYLEVMSDMISSVGVIIAAILIKFTGWKWVDSIIAIAIALFIIPRTWSLLKDSINILLEGVPKGIKLENINSELSKIEGVLNIHDLHIWAISSDKINFTAHIVYSKNYDQNKILNEIKEVLEHKFHITHVTIQLELENCGQDREHGNK